MDGWRVTDPLARAWREHGARLRWGVASAPATYIYLGILVVTTWVLLGMPSAAKTAFIEDQSTNLMHLSKDPVRVLVRSAFFVTKRELLVWALLFGLVLAPVERWLGTARAIAAFAIGHIGATCLTAIDIWAHIRYMHAPHSLWNTEDTGASYGFFTLAGVLVHRLRGWTRWALILVLAGFVVWGFLEGTGPTARGHSVSILLGLLLYPVTRRAAVRARRGPGRSIVDLWRPSRADGAPRAFPASGSVPEQ